MLLGGSSFEEANFDSPHQRTNGQIEICLWVGSLFIWANCECPSARRGRYLRDAGRGKEAIRHANLLAFGSAATRLGSLRTVALPDSTNLFALLPCRCFLMFLLNQLRVGFCFGRGSMSDQVEAYGVCLV